MRTEEVRFPGAGLRLHGLLRVPDATPSGRLPLVVHGPGFLGLAGAAHYARYHAGLAAAGYAVLAFDYRGYGASEGEPGWIVPERQVEDIRSALRYVETRKDLDASRVALLGVGGTGAGNAVIVAANEAVRAVAVMHAVADGREWLRGMRGPEAWDAFLARVAAGDALVDPRDEIMVQSAERRAAKRTTDELLPQRFHLASATSLLAYRPVDVAHRVRALLLLSVAGDAVTPEHHAKALYERALPPKRLVRLTGTTHYRSHEQCLDLVVRELVSWYDRHVRGVASGAEAEIVEVAA